MFGKMRRGIDEELYIHALISYAIIGSVNGFAPNRALANNGLLSDTWEQFQWKFYDNTKNFVEEYIS